jgi:hypothetical protein
MEEVKYTEDELDYARERVAIMMEGEGLSYEDARAEVEKMIITRRGKRRLPCINEAA